MPTPAPPHEWGHIHPTWSIPIPLLLLWHSARAAKVQDSFYAEKPSMDGEPWCSIMPCLGRWPGSSVVPSCPLTVPPHCCWLRSPAQPHNVVFLGRIHHQPASWSGCTIPNSQGKQEVRPAAGGGGEGAKFPRHTVRPGAARADWAMPPRYQPSFEMQRQRDLLHSGSAVVV